MNNVDGNHEFLWTSVSFPSLVEGKEEIIQVMVEGRLSEE